MLKHGSYSNKHIYYQIYFIYVQKGASIKPAHEFTQTHMLFVDIYSTLCVYKALKVK